MECAGDTVLAGVTQKDVSGEGSCDRAENRVTIQVALNLLLAPDFSHEVFDEHRREKPGVGAGDSWHF